MDNNLPPSPENTYDKFYDDMSQYERALYLSEVLKFNVIPVPHKSKEPIISWNIFKTIRSNEKQLADWLENNNDTNIAIMC